MHDAIKMMESKMTPESVARSRLMAEQEILAIRLGQVRGDLEEKRRLQWNKSGIAEQRQTRLPPR
jgi:hypothetical protein